jgi:hypothetical protein
MSSDDNVRVRRRARAMEIDGHVAVERDPLDPGPHIALPPSANNLAARAREIMNADRAAGREFILQHLLPMVQMHRPADDIARAFGVSIMTISRWKKILYARMGDELRTKTPHDFLSKMIGELEDTKSWALAQARSLPGPNIARTQGPNGTLVELSAGQVNLLTASQQRWVNIALKCQQQIADLYARAGILTEAPLKAVKDSDETDQGALALAQVAQAFLTGGYTEAKGKLAEKTNLTDPNLVQSVDDESFML